MKREGGADGGEEEGLQRVEPCCQGHIDFGRSNRLLSVECGPGERSAAGAKNSQNDDHKRSGCMWVL